MDVDAFFADCLRGILPSCHSYSCLLQNLIFSQYQFAHPSVADLEQ